MIAHVALLRRLPRRIDYLDYLVPDGLVVERGDLVQVPFRTASVRGVVLSLTETPPLPEGRSGGVGAKLKSVERIEYKSWISDQQLLQIEATAAQLIQSVSTVLHAVEGANVDKVYNVNDVNNVNVVNPTIRQSEVPYIRQAIELVRTNQSCFIEAIDFVQMAAIVEAIKKTAPGPHRVFVPHHHDAQLIPGSLTRIGALALGPKPGVDIVVRSSVPEHASYDRNPRYDTRDLVRADKVVFLDVAPRVADFVRFEQRLTLPSDLIEPPTVIDLLEQKKAGFSSLLTDPLVEAISKALRTGKNVLLSYNRKGFGAGLICRDCGYQPRCKTCGGVPTVYEATMNCHHCGTEAPIMAQCPKCGSAKLTSRGVGNQQVEKKLKELFPEIEVIRVEKGGNKPIFAKLTAPTIILATRYFVDALLNPYNPPPFGLVADLSADIGLSDPSFSASEQTLIRLLELRGVAFRARCPFVVQTWDVALIKKMLIDHHAFLEEERTLREQAQLPPYGTIYRLSTRGDAKIAEVKQTLSSALVGLRMREHDERKKPVLELYVRQGLSGNLRSALKQLKDDVIIEVNPET